MNDDKHTKGEKLRRNRKMLQKLGITEQLEIVRK
jgi:hypothetical protein